jgi:AcrR family transcriptional regulator
MPKRESNPRGEGDVLRAQLVDAAAAMLLAPRGIELPSLRAVARACGVSPAAVYLHFESQHALIIAVIEAQLGELASYVRDRLAAAADSGQLEALGIAYAEWALAHPGGYQLLFESADELATEEHNGEPGWELVYAVESQLRAAGLSDAAAKSSAYRLWASIHGVVSLRLHKPDLVWPSDWRDDILKLIAQAKQTK